MMGLVDKLQDWICLFGGITNDDEITIFEWFNGLSTYWVMNLGYDYDKIN